MGSEGKCPFSVEFLGHFCSQHGVAKHYSPQQKTRAAPKEGRGPGERDRASFLPREGFSPGLATPSLGLDGWGRGVRSGGHWGTREVCALRLPGPGSPRPGSERASGARLSACTGADPHTRAHVCNTHRGSHPSEATALRGVHPAGAAASGPRVLRAVQLWKGQGHCHGHVSLLPGAGLWPLAPGSGSLGAGLPPTSGTVTAPCEVPCPSCS